MYQSNTMLSDKPNDIVSEIGTPDNHGTRGWNNTPELKKSKRYCFRSALLLRLSLQNVVSYFQLVHRSGRIDDEHMLETLSP